MLEDQRERRRLLDQAVQALEKQYGKGDSAVGLE